MSAKELTSTGDGCFVVMMFVLTSEDITDLLATSVFLLQTLQCYWEIRVFISAF